MIKLEIYDNLKPALFFMEEMQELKKLFIKVMGLNGF